MKILWDLKILWELVSRWVKFCEILSHSVRYGMYVTGVLKFRIQELQALYYLGSKKQRPWSDCADVQAVLRLYCLHMAYTGFLMTRLKCNHFFHIKKKYFWGIKTEKVLNWDCSCKCQITCSRLCKIHNWNLNQRTDQWSCKRSPDTWSWYIF